ncbi:hypothetical protein ABEW32_03430 [Paenibacillus jamilae]|uniref:hypothetical protein n=1 Tax=Paenibacillus jamilae TaxID=114136 RepID=UPI003D2A7703
MNQLSSVFDYSSLPKEIADFLKEKENKMNVAVSNAYTEIGQNLKEAQEELSKHGYGCFEEWYTAIGMKKNQVYRLLQRYELIVANCNKRDLIEDLPISLVHEISKPSANPEAVQAVLNEDITTRKEYLELLKSLKQAQKQAETAKNSANHFEHLWQEAKNQPPQIIERPIEVVPDSLKKKIENLEFENNDLRHGYKNAKQKLLEYEVKDTAEFDEEKSRRQLNKLQLDANYNSLEVRVHINKFLEKVAISSYMLGAIASSDAPTKKSLQQGIQMLEEFTKQIKGAINGRIIGGNSNE